MPTITSQRVLIEGATGPTGLLIVRQALEHGHIVTVFARNISKIPSDISNLLTIKVRSRLFLSLTPSINYIIR